MRKIILLLFIFTITASITSHIFQQKWYFYRKAESAFFKEHYEEALFSYLQALRWGIEEDRVAPHFLSALNKMGGNLDKLDPFMQRIKKESQKSYLLTKIALLYLLENHPSEAEKILHLSLKNNHHPEGFLLLARALFWQGKSKEALVQYKKALSIDPNNDPLRHEVATVLTLEKHYEEALHHLKKILQKKPSSGLILEVAYLLFCQHKTFAALEIVERLSENEIDEKNQLLVARLYAKENRYERAKNSYEYYLEKNPHHLKARLELANLHRKKKNNSYAIDEYRKILDKEPGDCYVRRELAQVLLEEYQIEEAKKELLRSLDSASKESLIPPEKRINDFQTRLVLARLFYHQEGNLEKALDHYSILLQQKPSYAKLHLEMGELLQKLGNNRRALEEFQKVKELQPTNIRAYLNESKIYLEKGEYEKAYQLLKTLPQTTPCSQKLYKEVARFFKSHHQLEKALSIYKELVNIKEDKILFEETADLLVEAGQSHDSLYYYQKALHMDPRSQRIQQKIQALVQKEKLTLPLVNKEHTLKETLPLSNQEE